MLSFSIFIFGCFHWNDKQGWGVPYIEEEEKGRRGEGEKGKRGKGERGRGGEREKGRRGEKEKGRMGDPALEAVADPSRGIVREFAIRRMGDYTLFILN